MSAFKPSKTNDGAEKLAECIRPLFASDQIVELRALDVRLGRGGPHVEAGFFDFDHLLDMCSEAQRLTPISKGVYFTLNAVNPQLLARCCNHTQWAGSGSLTKDKDIIRRRFLLVDADPIRDALVSSTDAEKAESLTMITTARSFLRDRGWTDPILADSGNGYHLLYRIDEPVDDGDVIKRCLQALAARFDTDRVKIDTSVHNASRICKFPGTWARKGDSTKDRPHRQSRIIEFPEGL